MKLVSSYGEIYRISDREYRKQLRLIANGDGYDLEKARCIGVLDTDLTSLTQDEAQYMLEESK